MAGDVVVTYKHLVPDIGVKMKLELGDKRPVTKLGFLNAGDEHFGQKLFDKNRGPFLLIPLVLTDDAVTPLHEISGVGATLVEQSTSHQACLSFK